MHTVGGQSNISRSSPPGPDEVARLADLAHSLQPAPVSQGPQAAPQRNLRRRLPPHAIIDLVNRYSAGESVLTLSQDYGISESGLRDLLRAEGVTLRGHRITTADAQRAVQLYERGLPSDQVAKQLAYAWGTIHRVLIRNGVALRTDPDLDEQ